MVCLFLNTRSISVVPRAHVPVPPSYATAQKPAATTEPQSHLSQFFLGIILAFSWQKFPPWQTPKKTFSGYLKVTSNKNKFSVYFLMLYPLPSFLIFPHFLLHFPFFKLFPCLVSPDKSAKISQWKFSAPPACYATPLRLCHLTFTLLQHVILTLIMQCLPHL